MKELIKKDNLTIEELEEIDNYFSYEEHIEELVLCDTKEIIRILELIEDTLGYCLSQTSLNSYISNETIGIQCLFEEENMDQYNKYLELIDHFKLTDYGLGFTIADYYYEDNLEIALKYYKRVFKEGYDLSNIGYYYSLERYLKLLNKNPVEELIKLINASPNDGEYSLDFVNTYLLLIINLEKDDERYIRYIEEAIKVATVVAREVQENAKSRFCFSDTDEERNLCELLSLKFEYYVNKKEYLNAYDIYKELTHEIGLSDCTRYYHARDLFYRQMIEYMSEDYPELKFFNDIGYCKFKILTKINDINDYLNKEIMLEKESGERFKFVIVNIYEDNDITIAPILPLLGQGGLIFVSLVKENDEFYLENKLNS